MILDRIYEACIATSLGEREKREKRCFCLHLGHPIIHAAQVEFLGCMGNSCLKLAIIHMLAFLMLIDHIQWIILWFEDLFNLILILGS